MRAQNNLPFINVETAENTLQQLRIRLIQFILILLFLTGIFFTLSFVVSGDNIFSGDNAVAPITIIVSLGLFFTVNRGYLISITSVIVIAYIIALGVYLFVLFDDINLLFLILSLAAIAISLLLGRLNFWAFNGILLSIVVSVSLLTTLQETSLSQASVSSFLITLSFGLIPMTISGIARSFIAVLNHTANRAQRSLNVLVANADIGKNISEMESIDGLLTRSVETIHDRFGFYHVSLFLTDNDNRFSHLSASTGEVGKQMLARGHRLPIDSKSVVGRTTMAKDVIVVREAQFDTGQSYNELLPNTRSELGIPILDTQGVIGVIDIQSEQLDAFSPTEIEALQVIANQLATAIRNTRLFADKENTIRENQRLFIESETNLREIQRLNRQLTKQAWSDYLVPNRRIDGVTLSNDGFRNRADWSEEMVAASQKRRAITEDKDGKRTIAVPIELRGEVVGAIELETEQHKNPDDMVDMVRTISQNLGVSLDNARLFEESNEATAQEQQVSKIVSQYQSAESVDDLLRLTIKGLAETLGAERASIRLGVVPDVAPFEGKTSDEGSAL